MKRPASGGAVRRWSYRLAVGTAGLAAALLASAWLKERLLSSDRLALAEVVVVGALRLDSEEVRAKVGLPEGINLLAIDTQAVEARVRELSWVASARVDRQFPDRLRVHVQEHDPVALVAFGDLFYVASSGEVFRAYRTGDPLGLPVINGIERERFERGEPEAVGRLETALAFLRTWASRLPTGDLREIEVGAAGLVRAVTAEGMSIWVGPRPWAAALDRVAPILRARPGLDEVIVGRGRRSDRVVVRGPEVGGAGSSERWRDER